MKPPTLMHPPSPWLRRVLAMLLLGFALSTVAHAGHSHERSAAGAHEICGYCATFNHAAAPPTQLQIRLAPQFVIEAGGVERTDAATARPEITAQPRAPPSR